MMVFIEKNLIYKKYDLIIGIDRLGLLEADILSRIDKTPFVYISFEIMFEDETSPRFKSLEKSASKDVSAWLVQDEVRAEFLQKENQLDISKKFLLPLASSGMGTHSDQRLRDSLGIPENKKVAIVIGSISNWSMATQLIKCAANWPDSWVLIIHDRYGRTTELLKGELSSLSYLVNKKIYISNAATDMVDDMGGILEGISAGLAFYEADYSSPYTGKNLEHLGLASGKISTYLRYGIPVLMNEIGLYADEAREFQFGWVVDSPEQIKDCLENIDTGQYSKNAIEYFSRKLDFNNYKKNIYSNFLSLDTKQNSAA